MPRRIFPTSESPARRNDHLELAISKKGKGILMKGQLKIGVSLLAVLTVSLKILAPTGVRFQAASAKEMAQAPAEPPEITVRYKLNAIETSKLLEHYQSLLKREMSLQDSVRACARSGDERLPQYVQALQETRDDLANTRK